MDTDTPLSSHEELQEVGSSPTPLGVKRGALFDLPPFLLGAAASAVGWISAVLLLYSTTGLRSAASLLIAVSFVSVGIGLGAGARSNSRLDGRRLFRRWRLVLFSFLLAAGYATFWSLFRGLGTSALTQGLGLALLVGLPLYSLGLLLGEMSRTDIYQGGRLGSATAFGVAGGTLLIGPVMIPRFDPASILFLALAAISFGALIHGRLMTRAELSGRTYGSADDHSSPVPEIPLSGPGNMTPGSVTATDMAAIDLISTDAVRNAPIGRDSSDDDSSQNGESQPL